MQRDLQTEKKNDEEEKAEKERKGKILERKTDEGGLRLSPRARQTDHIKAGEYKAKEDKRRKRKNEKNKRKKRG